MASISARIPAPPEGSSPEKQSITGGFVSVTGYSSVLDAGMADMFSWFRFPFSGAVPGAGRASGFIRYDGVYNNASFEQWELQMAYKKWVCVVCGYQYDEELGDPDHGLAAGQP